MENEKCDSNFNLINKNKTCIIILGPTGIGKTKISLALANFLRTEIINTDAFSFYKNAEIMTAKANKQEKELALHHLIDFLDIENVEFSVSNFKLLFDNSIDSIFNKEKIPIIVGGSNYYVEYILFDKRINILDIEKSSLENAIENNKNDFLKSKLKDRLFVREEQFINLMENLKKSVSESSSDISNQQDEIQLLQKNKKLKKELLSKKDLTNLTIEILNHIQQCYLFVLEKLSDRFTNEEFLSSPNEIAKTENLLFDALTGILEYKNSNLTNLNIDEKEYSLILHGLIAVIDSYSYNLFHKNDLRRIINVLKYFFVYGRAKSHLLDNQIESQQFDNANDKQFRYENSIIVFLKFSNYDIFRKRVNSRIDQMLNQQNGLEEVFIIFEYFNLKEKNNQSNNIEKSEEEYNFDFQRGILQAIGYKEFYDFYILIKKVFNEFLNNFKEFNYENSIEKQKENLSKYFQIFNVNFINENYLLESLKAEGSIFTYQILLILFINVFKRKLYNDSKAYNESYNDNIILKYISEFIQDISSKESFNNFVEVFEKSKNLLLSNTLNYAKSQIKFIEKRILPNLNSKFTKDNKNLLIFEIEEFKEEAFEKIIAEIIKSINFNLHRQEDSSYLSSEIGQLEIENKLKIKKDNKKKEWKKFTCEICGFIELNGEHEYKTHLESNKHKKRKRNINKYKQIIKEKLEKEILDKNIE